VVVELEAVLAVVAVELVILCVEVGRALDTEPGRKLRLEEAEGGVRLFVAVDANIWTVRVDSRVVIIIAHSRYHYCSQ
jgi:hypothetical protein